MAVEGDDRCCGEETARRRGDDVLEERRSAGGGGQNVARQWVTRRARWVRLLVMCLSVAAVGAQLDAALYLEDPASCAELLPVKSFAFSIATLSCVACETPTVPSATGFGCVCPAGWKATYSVALKRVCEQCPDAFPEVSRDGLSCLACVFSTGGLTPSTAVVSNSTSPDETASSVTTNPAPTNSSEVEAGAAGAAGVPAETSVTVDSKGVCSCPVGHIMSDLNATGQTPRGFVKTCILCPFTSYVDASDPYTCRPCPDDLMSRDPSSGVCVCKQGYVEDSSIVAENTPAVISLVGRHVCLDRAVVATLTVAYKVAQYAKFSFYDTLDAGGSRTQEVTVEQSAPFMTYFMEAAAKCSSARNEEACQTLANLCALQLHDEEAPSCKVLEKLTQMVLNKEVHGFKGWNEGFPWTQYTEQPRDILFSTGINRVVSLNGEGSVVAMTLSKYALNGTFLGFEALTTQLTLCRGDERLLASYQKFGSNVRRECTVDLKTLIAEPEEPVFYELWVEDPVDVTGETLPIPALWPVPVIVANYREGASSPNAFLAEDLAIDWNVGSQELDKIVLHRRFFLVDHVSGRKSKGTTPDRLDPKLEVVRWAKQVILRVSLQQDDPSTPFDESVRIFAPYVVIAYEQQQTSIIPEEEMGFGGEDESYRYAPISFRSQYTMQLDGYWAAMLILFILMIIVTIIDFGVKASVRTQSSAMDPVGLAADFFGSVAGVFFWSVWFFAAYWFFFFKLQSEPTTLMPLENPHHSYLILVILAMVCKVMHVILLVYRQCCIDIFFIDWEKEKAPEDGISKPKKGELPNVSVWRYILIANEWCEMQGNRHTDVDFTLMFVLLFLAGLKFENLATQQPNASDLTPGDPNMVVRFFVISMFYFLVVLIQVLYKAVTYRFEQDPLDHFADLCQLANISTFILDEELHGYYIHGRAVHPHCDVNMQKMQANLEAEAEGNLPFRGLTQKGEADLNGASDVVFELYVSQAIRDKYRDHVSAATGAKRGPGRAEIQSQAQHKINDFLATQVVDNLAQNASDAVILPSILHKIISSPPAKIREAAVLIRDNGNLYSRVLLYGIEYDLILFDLLVFVIWDLVFVDVFIAALLTYVMAHAIVELRSKYGTANVAAKTLVDERFLS